MTSLEYIEITTAYWRPDIVDPQDIQKNGLLLTPQHILKVKNFFQKNPHQWRLAQHHSKLPYTIIKFEETNDLLYKKKAVHIMQFIRDPDGVNCLGVEASERLN